MRSDVIPYQICLVACNLFSEKGYDAISMADIARKAGLSEAEVFTFFGNKQDIVLFLYKSINSDWQLFVNELREKKLAARFEKALIKKVDLMAPYADILANMMSSLLGTSKIGIHGPRTSHIRDMGLQTMQTLITGADDSATLKKKIPQLPALLYVMHWAVLFLHVQTNSRDKTTASVELVAKMLKRANNFSFLMGLFPFLKEISAWAEKLLNEEEKNDHTLDRKILRIIFNHRKTSEAVKACIDHSCETCMSLHEKSISFFTSQNKPLHFILPAFPAKSPNKAKVLGTLPDLGEEIALKTLEDLCNEIKSIYSPGAQITICSDGRIFSELVSVTDENVSEYVKGIRDIIEKLKLEHVSIVNLEDLMTGGSFDELRSKVLANYAEPIEELHDRLKQGGEFKSLFNGIHRFITEDRKVLQPEKSATQVKEESKSIALKVIQHSNAWTRFLSYVYPDAIRLSIHPYPAHSYKIGVRLTKAADNWLTPWHGVVVLEEDGYVLMKRTEAEEKGAKLIMDQEKPYYYTLTGK